MNTLFLLAASLTAMATFSVHVFIGGRFVAAPLLADTALPKAAKWLAFMCWHFTSIYLFGLIGAYAWAGVTGTGRPMITLLTLLNAGFCAMSMTAARMGGIAPWRFPSTTLFALLAGLGALALIV
jgi:hypothetical protein